MFKKSLPVAVLVVAGLFTLAACGNSGNSMSDMGDTSSTAPTSSSDEGGFNDGDVEFATDMIPHHRQAIEMAELAESRTSSPKVKRLAKRIENAQDPEIETMSGWLTSWGEPLPTDMGGHDMSGSMPGMMTMEEMTELEAASGAEFDEMFLTMMIKHHEGAIDMAETEQRDGAFPDAVALAEQIESAQTAEIETMRALLN